MFNIFWNVFCLYTHIWVCFQFEGRTVCFAFGDCTNSTVNLHKNNYAKWLNGLPVLPGTCHIRYTVLHPWASVIAKNTQVLTNKDSYNMLRLCFDWKMSNAGAFHSPLKTAIIRLQFRYFFLVPPIHWTLKS